MSEQKVFRKTYKNKKGEEEKIEYTYPDVKTQNEQLSENIIETVQGWLDDGYKEERTIPEIKNIPLGSTVRYITNINGKLQARKGGFLTKKEEKYFMLKNVQSNIQWSVQYKDIVTAHWKISPLQKKKEPSKQVKDSWETLLEKFYYEQGNFVGADKIYHLIKQENSNITRSFVREWLGKQDLYQITKPPTKSKAIRSLIPKDKYKIIAIDLIDFNKIGNVNLDYKYVLVGIDLFSKYGWVEAMKNKTPVEMKKAFEKMRSQPNYQKFSVVLSDNGKEFTADSVKNYFKKLNMKQIHTSPHSPWQNNAERFIGTLKGMIKKTWLENENQDWINYIDNIVDNYNNQQHSTLDMSPIEALKDENHDNVSERLEKHKIKREIGFQIINVGDMVRLREYKKQFKQGAVNWTKEVFSISKVIIPKNPLHPIRYKVEDLEGEPISGEFNQNDLQKITIFKV